MSSPIDLGRLPHASYNPRRAAVYRVALRVPGLARLWHAPAVGIAGAWTPWMTIPPDNVGTPRVIVIARNAMIARSGLPEQSTKGEPTAMNVKNALTAWTAKIARSVRISAKISAKRGE
jgi:hypothetical protein